MDHVFVLNSIIDIYLQKKSVFTVHSSPKKTTRVATIVQSMSIARASKFQIVSME